MIRQPRQLAIALVASLAFLSALHCGPPRPQPVPVAPTPTPPTPPAPPAPLDGAPLDSGGQPLLNVLPVLETRPRVLAHRGVNLSGAEFGAVPGTVGRDYGYPTKTDVDLFVQRGITHVRLPFRHERLQRQLKTELDAAEWDRLITIVTYMTERGLTVALEPHNSARFYDRVLTETEIGDFWGRVGRRLVLLPAVHPRVLPNLTNEPRDMTTETWLALAQASIRELRRVGFPGRILVPGNGWTGAMHWTSSWYGRSNADVMVAVTDPAAVFEVHLYLDQDGSGGGKECVSESVGVERLAGFVAWLKRHDRKGYVGEIGAPNTVTCARAVRNALTFIESEPTYFLGWSWWSAGARWPIAYPLSVQPLAVDAGAGVGTLYADRPQFEWLRPFFACRCALAP